MLDTAIIEAYLKLGCLGLCCVVLIAAFILLLKKIINFGEKSGNFTQTEMSQLINVVTNRNTELFEQVTKNNQVLMDEILHKITNHTPSEDENHKLTQISEQIDIVLQDILLRTGACRVSLVQYHNGGRGINKQSFLKMSITNEQVQIGVKPFMPEFKDQFRSVLAYFVKQLNDTGKCFIKDLEEIKTIDTSMYEFMNNRGIQSKFGIAIKSSDTFVIGFVCIEFTKKTNPDIDKIDKVLSEKQDTIQTLLNMKI